jgi:hypothetical protein
MPRTVGKLDSPFADAGHSSLVSTRTEGLMKACRVSIEHRAKRFTGNYTVRGSEVTVTSLEHGQLSSEMRLLSPPQLALVLLLKLARTADESCPR